MRRNYKSILGRLKAAGDPHVRLDRIGTRDVAAVAEDLWPASRKSYRRHPSGTMMVCCQRRLPTME